MMIEEGKKRELSNFVEFHITRVRVCEVKF